MSTPFTVIDSDTDLFAVDLVNELVDAYNERKKVSRILAVPDMTQVQVDDDGQDPAGVLDQLQTAVSDIVDRFVNHDVAISGESAITMFNATSWRSAAGLHADGWRRATDYDPDANDWTNINDPMFSYGAPQENDIVGPWLWVDLQNGLSTLKWTTEQVTEGSYEYKLHEVWEASCAAALAALSYPGSWTVGGDVFTPYQVLALLADQGPAPTEWRGLIIRDRVKSRMTISDIVPCDVDVWYRVGGHEFLPFPYDNQFQDFDGLGMGEGNYYLYESIPAVDPPVADVEQTDWFGPDVDLLTLATPACKQCLIARSDRCDWVLKWQFTHSN